MDGWSNNSSYTSGTTSSGGWGNSGQSATSRGYGSSSSDYSSSSHDDSSYWSNNYGGGSGNQSAPVAAANKISGSQSPMQSRVEAKVDAKTPENVTDRKASLTGGGLAGPVAAPNANYWSGPYDGWRANTNYTAGAAGTFGTHEANMANISAIKNKTAHEGQIETAKAQVAGWNTVNARDSVSGLLGFMGGAAAGPIGGYAAGKAAGFGAEKLSDYTSGFKDNPAYNESKRMTEDDSSIYGTVAGKIAPAGTGGMVRSAVNDATGTYRQDMQDMQKALREGGYIDTQARPTFQQSGSGGSAPNSLLANMYQTQQQPAEAYNYEQPLLNYDNNASYYRGSVY